MPKDLITVDKKIEIQVPDYWNYDISVRKFRNLSRKVKEKGGEALIEVRIAHEILTEDSMRKQENRKWPDKTFEKYCQDIGYNKSTVYSWLQIHFPDYYNSQVKRAIVGIPTIPLLPEGKFNVIYADPPWRYDFSKSESRSIDSHYESLSLDEICNYKDSNETPVQDKFADEAVLFLWATQPKIREALQVIEAWGFNYTTGAIWVKDKFGMGYWWREKHELLFLAKKGNFPTPSPDNRPESVFEAPRIGHSKKPDKVYKMIEDMCPGGTYLELFARSGRQNWVGFGKEYNANI